MSITTAIFGLRCELQKLGPGYPEVELKMTFKDPHTAFAFKDHITRECGAQYLTPISPTQVTMLAGVRLRFMYKQHAEGEV